SMAGWAATARPSWARSGNPSRNSSPRRRKVSGRLARLRSKTTVPAWSRMHRCIAKAEPNDVDIVLLMEDTFDLASVTGEAALVFQHPEAHAHFGASVFWTRRSGALGGEQAMVEYWQVRREGGQRGIVEIMPEGS